MARKRARRPRDRVYRILQHELKRVDPKERKTVYAGVWTFIANLRARSILGLSDEDPENPGESED